MQQPLLHGLGPTVNEALRAHNLPQALRVARKQNAGNKGTHVAIVFATKEDAQRVYYRYDVYIRCAGRNYYICMDPEMTCVASAGGAVRRTAMSIERLWKRKAADSPQETAPATKARKTSAPPVIATEQPIPLSNDNEGPTHGRSLPPSPAVFPANNRIKAVVIHSGIDVTSTPCKPKLNDEHCLGLQKMAHLAFPAAVARFPNALPEHVKQRYEECREEGRLFASLAKLPACKQVLLELLRGEADWDGWDSKLWRHPGVSEEAGEDDKLFWRILRVSLAQAWVHLMPGPDVGMENHERSAWIDHVVSWFSPLRLTKFVSWRWCEYKYSARNVARQTKDGYAPSSTKYGDALGSDPTTRHERLLMEASSGLDKEVAKEDTVREKFGNAAP
ncbi:hypothetical protein HDU87_007173 [Geranomyces variabilis]|uniref:Uncharacterized protein n=1 Tax=Geranomyces variabilis TaxID=109894 RepID=A0AAD5XQ18_9FUNG|nr:hypothetical protein HDU87_007173 [Geranomyces variabilis]